MACLTSLILMLGKKPTKVLKKYLWDRQLLVALSLQAGCPMTQSLISMIQENVKQLLKTVLGVSFLQVELM